MQNLFCPQNDGATPILNAMTALIWISTTPKSAF